MDELEKRVEEARDSLAMLLLEVTEKDQSVAHEISGTQITVKMAELFMWLGVAVEGTKAR